LIARRRDNSEERGMGGFLPREGKDNDQDDDDDDDKEARRWRCLEALAVDD